jgi:hypothetical protein
MTKEQYEQEMVELYRKSLRQGNEPRFSSVFCYGNFGKQCILCELCKEILFDKRTYEGTPTQTRARDLNRKSHYFSNIIFIANPSDIVVFDYGEKYIFNKLLSYQVGPDSDHKNFFHPVMGKNIVITKIQYGTDRRSISYDVEARPNTSRLPDMGVLELLKEDKYNLDKIVDNIRMGVIVPYPQYKLPLQRTELRFLPSWLGIDIPKFYKHLMIHHNISQEEYEAVQNRQLDPFSMVRTKESLFLSKSSPSKVYVYVEPTPKPTATTTSIPKLTATTTSIHSPAEPSVVATTPLTAFPTSSLPPTTATTPLTAFPTSSLPPTAAQVLPSLDEGDEDEEDEGVSVPICYGKKYDPNDPNCAQSCVEDGWADSCKTLTEKTKKQLEARRTARRLVAK